MKLFFTLFIVTFFYKFISAQNTFQKIFRGGDGQSVEQTLDSGFIIAGVRNKGNGDRDVYLIKTDSNGDTLWTKTFGGILADEAFSIVQTIDLGYIVVGQTKSFGAGNIDIYVIRTNQVGDTIWTKTYGGALDDLAFSIQQTNDNGYIIAGATQSFGAGSSDIYLIKISPNGNIIWTKSFGGIAYDYAKAVKQTIDGGYIILGSTGSFGAGNWDVYLIKTDQNGDSLWTKVYGGTGSDNGNSIVENNDGGFIIAGYTNSYGAGSEDFYLIKTNIVGDTLWTKVYGGQCSDLAFNLQQTNDSGYIITGRTESCIHTYKFVYLIKTNSDGDTLWTRTYGTINADLSYFNHGFFVKQVNDSGYIIAGNTQINHVEYVYLIKTDSNGDNYCNQGNTTTFTGSTSSHVSRTHSIVSTGGTVTNPPTILSSGGFVGIPCSTLGFKDIITKNSILFSPNPFTDEISIKETKKNGITLIFDMAGKEILRQKTIDGETKIRTTYIKSGFYFLNYINDTENKSVKVKILKIN